LTIGITMSIAITIRY